MSDVNKVWDGASTEKASVSLASSMLPNDGAALAADAFLQHMHQHLIIGCKRGSSRRFKEGPAYTHSLFELLP